MLFFPPTHPTCKVDHRLKLRGCQIYHIQPISASNTQAAVVPAGARKKKTYGKQGLQDFLDHIWKDGTAAY